MRQKNMFNLQISSILVRSKLSPKLDHKFFSDWWSILSEAKFWHDSPGNPDPFQLKVNIWQILKRRRFWNAQTQQTAYVCVRCRTNHFCRPRQSQKCRPLEMDKKTKKKLPVFPLFLTKKKSGKNFPTNCKNEAMASFTAYFDRVTLTTIFSKDRSSTHYTK